MPNRNKQKQWVTSSEAEGNAKYVRSKYSQTAEGGENGDRQSERTSHKRWKVQRTKQGGDINTVVVIQTQWAVNRTEKQL